MIPEPDCRLCGLCSRRTNIVLPDGNPGSGIVFVGEAPGENEDLEGRPFVGRSGKILDGMMAEAGLDVADGPAYEGLEHWVEQAITRDVAVAVRRF